MENKLLSFSLWEKLLIPLFITIKLSMIPKVPHKILGAPKHFELNPFKYLSILNYQSILKCGLDGLGNIKKFNIGLRY